MCAILSQCTPPLYGPRPNFNTLNGVYIKTEKVISPYMESTPFVWTDENIYILISIRALGSNQIIPHFGIYKFDIKMLNLILVAEFADGYFFPSCFVDNGKLIVFGVLSDGLGLYRMESYDMINWSTPAKIIDAPNGYHIFNSSLMKAPDGYYTTVEVEQFHEIIYKSQDSNTWVYFSTPDLPTYSACASLRFINGYFYMWYTASFEGGWYYTKLARSIDGISWTNSKYDFGVPSPGIDENNFSDLDLCEFNGQVIINYAVGNQHTYANIKNAFFYGTLVQLVALYF